MTRPTNQPLDAVTVPPSRFDSDWHVDDEGVLHTGRSAPFAECVVVANDCGGDRP
ncbi:hypothetical protein [Haloterrigena sp. H1]|uniref:hypothetical protein n=1 Tax=Haloterrigena sp. H1 TaxID=2552943 RepID=UPI001486B925|nr:hypothetical protein [Haloterrigena sp. H1]